MKRAPQRGTAFGRYLLFEPLAEGRMAQLWRARLAGREHDGHELVVKTLHPRLCDQPLFAERFAAEARVTRPLSHDGIVRIVDDGKVKGVPFVAMERIDGWDLAALMRARGERRRPPVAIVLAVAIELCRAVGYAHQWRDEHGKARPIVHGDLSPSNVMVRRDGGVTLIGFGVAHMSRRATRGRAHLVIGERGYLAPELLDDAVADARSDVFSLGALIHELLCGRPLFAVESERETLRRLSEAPIAAPSRSNPHVPAELDAIVLRALNRNPATRFYPSANELADALEKVRTPQAALQRQVADWVNERMAPADRVEPGTPTRRRAAAPAAAPARPRVVEPRRRASRSARMLVAVAALVVAIVVPLPNAPAVRWPLVRTDAPADATRDRAP